MNSSLISTTPKTEKKLTPIDRLGDFDFEVEGYVKPVIQGAGSFISEVVSLGKDIAGIDSSEPSLDKTKFPSKGSIEFNSQKQAELEERMKRAQQETQSQQLSREIAGISSARDRKDWLDNKRAEINSKIGIKNASYEDTVRDDGSLRADVEVDLERANSELTEEQIKSKKENQVAQATGKINYFMQHNMAGERQGGQHVFNAPG